MGRTMSLGLLVAISAAVCGVLATSATAATYDHCVYVKGKGRFITGGCFELISYPKGTKFHYDLAPVVACEAHKKGKYSNPGCTELDERRGKPKGKYEIAAGREYATSSGQADLEIPGLDATMECAASTGTGEIATPTTTVEQVTFTGCHLEGSECQNTATAGEVQTYPLESSLIEHGETFDGREPAAKEIWSALHGEAAHGGYTSMFECPGVGFLRTSGDLAGRETGTDLERAALSGETIFETGTAVQGVQVEVSPTSAFEPGETLGPYPSSEVAAVATTWGTATEIVP